MSDRLQLHTAARCTIGPHLIACSGRIQREHLASNILAAAPRLEHLRNMIVPVSNSGSLCRSFEAQLAHDRQAGM